MRNRLKNLKSWHWIIAGASLFLLVGLLVALASEPDSGPASIKPVPASPASIVMEANGMYCSGCVRTVENSLSALGGVGSVEVNLGESQAKIWAASATSLRDKLLRKTVEDAGYRAGAIRRPK